MQQLHKHDIPLLALYLICTVDKKQTHIKAFIWFLTKVQKQFNRLIIEIENKKSCSKQSLNI